MDIDVDSEVCPICSYEFSEPVNVTRWVAVGLLVVIVGYLILQWIG